MINLRSSFSALAIAGAVFGYSSSAHAAIPALADVWANPINIGDTLGVTVTDSASKSGSYNVSITNDDGSTAISHSISGHTPFATAVDFTLASGSGVKWNLDNRPPEKFSNVTYKLVDGTPSQGSTTYSSLPVLASGDSFTFSGLTAGNSYALLVEGTALFSSGRASIDGTLSAVPLPGSLVMFGSALVGLTAIGARRRTSVSA